MSRYTRQEVLSEVGPDGQARLRAAHVLVVGAGGLGCPVLQYLTGAGVGRITLVDADVVSVTNLHRQTLYSGTQVGRPKALAAKEVLAGLNPEVTVVAEVARLGPENVDRLLEQVDLAFDCADSFAASYILSDACYARGTPLISASALGMEGYVGGFCAGAPSLRAVFPDLPQAGPTCATAGVLGPVVGTIGAMQAQMALNCLLGLAPSPLGQLVTLDCRTFRVGGFRFDGAPEPETPPFRFLPPEAISERDFVVELRDAQEAPVPVTPWAQRLNVDDFTPLGPSPGPGQRAVLCCRSGLRSWRAANLLQSYWEGEIRLVALGDTPETA